MTEWLPAILVALAVFSLAAAAVGLIAYIRLVDPFRVALELWIGDLTQGLIVLVATLAFLALAFASGEAYAYVAAAATAGAEAAGAWLLCLIRPLRTTHSAPPACSPASLSTRHCTSTSGIVRGAGRRQ